IRSRSSPAAPAAPSIASSSSVMPWSESHPEQRGSVPRFYELIVDRVCIHNTPVSYVPLTGRREGTEHVGERLRFLVRHFQRHLLDGPFRPHYRYPSHPRVTDPQRQTESSPRSD